MKRRIAAIAVASLLVLSAIGCGRADRPSVAGGLQVQAETVPPQTAANREMELRLHVTKDGHDVEMAQVTAFLEMKEMDHGENRLALQEQSGGVYSGRTTLPMGGDWIAHVRVEQNGHTDTANVPFQVSE